MAEVNSFRDRRVDKHLSNRYRNDRIRDPAGKRRLSLKNLLFPPEGKEISADEGNRFDPNVGKRATVLSSIQEWNGMEKKKGKEGEGKLLEKKFDP